jgi:riboflavin kinase/FMN adenylyltransferase
MRATQFLEDILVAGLKATEVVMGHDFAFGKGREGTPEWLTERIATTVASPVEVGGTRVSSTTIRRLICEGDMRGAYAMLARPHWISGVVVAGEQLGRRIGFPTINVARAAATLAPPDGVYAGACRTDLGVFRAAISIGCRPAVGGTSRAIEAHLLDYPGDDLYGQAVRVEVADRVRDEMKTATLDELRAQIERDVAHISATVSVREV